MGGGGGCFIHSDSKATCRLYTCNVQLIVEHCMSSDTAARVSGNNVQLVELHGNYMYLYTGQNMLVAVRFQLIFDLVLNV